MKMCTTEAIKIRSTLGMGMSTSVRALAEHVMWVNRRNALEGQSFFAVQEEYILLCNKNFPDCMRCPIGDRDIQCMAYRKNNPITFIKITKSYEW